MAVNTRRIGKDWTWFEDYVYVTATYTCFTPPGRRVQVGMGVFAFGEPRGEKVAITDKGQFTVVGPGSVPIRIYDDGPDCEVAITQDSNVLVPILRSTFWLITPDFGSYVRARKFKARASVLPKENP